MKLKKLSLIDFIFVLLLGLAVFFRFYHFEQTFEWGADNVRDFLVAKHIVKYHDFKWIAPWSFGSGNNLANSVFYYYFLTIFYILSFGQVIIYQLIFALFSFLVVGIYAYLIAKLFFREKVLRYITVLIFCFLPVFNVYGRSVFQPYFVLPFFMMSVYYLFLSMENKSTQKLSFAVFFYVLTLHFHYSALVVLPWIVGLIFYLQYTFNKKEKHFTWLDFLRSQLDWPLLIICFNFLFLILNQIIIRNGVDNGFISLSIFLKSIYKNLPFYPENLIKNFQVFVANMFGSRGIFEPIIVFLLFIISVTIYFFKKMNFYTTSLFFSLPLFFFIFLIIYSNGNLGYPSYYFAPFYMLLPLFLMSVWSNLKSFWKYFAMVSFFFIIMWFSTSRFKEIKKITNLEQIDKYQTIAKIINNDVKKNYLNSNDFIIFTIDDQLDWSSPPYWFYLENYLKHPLIETTWYKYNVIASLEKSKNIYLICDDPRVNWDKGIENFCLKRFDRGDFLQNKEEIFRVDSKNLIIYRLTLNEAISPYLVYYKSRIK